MKNILFILVFISFVFGQVYFDRVLDEDVNDAARQSILLASGGNSVDDLMIVVIGKDDDVAITDHADWNELVNVTSGTGNATYVAWRLWESGDTNWTFTSTDGNEDWIGWLFNFLGHNTTSPIHASNDSTSLNSTVLPPSQTYTDLTDNSMIIRGFTADDNDIPYVSYVTQLEIANNNNTDTGGAVAIDFATVTSQQIGGTAEPMDDVTTAISQSLEGADEYLNLVRVDISEVGLPAGNVFVKLYEHTGTFGTSSEPTGSALSTAVSIAANQTSGIIDFWFIDPYFLENGVYYCIVIEYSSGTSSNYITIDRNSASNHPGSYAYYDGSWNTNVADLVFFAYETSRSGTGAAALDRWFIQDNAEQWGAFTIVIEAAEVGGAWSWGHKVSGVTDPTEVQSITEYSKVMGVE